jgi:cytochrome c553
MKISDLRVGVARVATAAIALLLAAHCTAQTALSFDAMTERLEACIACHGKEGRTINAEYLPRIAGKPAGYLYNQLVNFRDGRRNNAVMSHLLQPLSDAYLREIAQYFSALDLPYPPPQAPKVSADALRLGETLVLRGDASRKLPACSRCHGTPMTGHARNSGLAWVAERLLERATRSVARGPAPCARAGLHGRNGEIAYTRRHQRRRFVARGAARTVNQ